MISRIRFDWEGSEKKLLGLEKSNYVGGEEKRCLKIQSGMVVRLDKVNGKVDGEDLVS